MMPVQFNLRSLLPRVFLLINLLLISGFSWSSEGFVVSDIRIEGLERLPDGTLLNYLPVQVGDPLDSKQIAFSIKELYKTGFFADVQLFRDGNALIVKVKERPSISEVKFSGNSDIDSKTLEGALEDIGIVQGRIYNRSLLEKLTQELERVYFSQGKYGIRIETEITELDQNRVDIDIKISEGRIALIKQINIIGNEKFDDEILLNELQLGVPGSFAVFSDSDEYSKPKLNADLEALRSYYLDRGYIKFTADSTQVSITPDKKDIYITINLEEGEQYTIGEVKLVGPMVVDEDVLKALILTKPDEIFSRKLMTSTQKQLEDRLGKVGYAFAKVKLVPEIDENKKTIDLTYQLVPGNKTQVRNINFHGNFRTHEEVLRREMRLMEGSILASDKLERSKIRLQRLSYLENVEVETKPVPGTDDMVDLEVSVEERLSGSFNIGAGFSQTQGFLFNVGLTQENLMGTGQRLAVNINTDSANTVYNISFTDPYYTIDGISRTIGLSFAKRDAAEEEINDFQTDSYSANVNYGIPLTEFSTLRLGYGWSHVELLLSSINPSLEASAFVNEHGDSYDNLLLNASYNYDTRNRTVFATRGSSQTVALDLSAPGSDLEFYKLSYLTSFYFGLTDDLTLLLRSNLAYGNGYGELDTLPFYERYFAGGLRTVRGFESNSLGPRDDYGDPTGGNMRVTAGADFIFPIPFVEKAPSSVRLSAFYDLGNVFLSSKPTYNSTKDGFAFEELRASAGLSFVWLAPIGPLRFSWTKALNDVEGDRLRVFQFSIGSFF
ncbi:MAG: outer membrane protein assembly factor BamA [Gammaproteobacteria bacterium]|nr:outer membrane protein assembly factor BamA [Gammaproteobacteria bacterium]